MSKISVIIPSYQHAETISDTVQSALDQTIEPFEIIVVDDGSTDGTEEVLLSFIESGQIKYHKQKNAGGPAARNKGFELSHGDYVIFLDADVIMNKQMLELLLGTLKSNPGAGYAYGAFRFGWKRFSSFPFSAEKLKQMNFIHTSALIRRAEFPGFDESLKRFQDWDLWLTMLERGSEGVYVEKELFRAIEARGRKGISSWRPSFFYKIPWKSFGFKPKSVSKYDSAKEKIYKKHNLWM